ncbi:hypothetical protein HDU98_007492, partial [Podochytrium sp. JEL0797]
MLPLAHPDDSLSEAQRFFAAAALARRLSMTPSMTPSRASAVAPPPFVFPMPQPSENLAYCPDTPVPAMLLPTQDDLFVKGSNPGLGTTRFGDHNPGDPLEKPSSSGSASPADPDMQEPGFDILNTFPVSSPPARTRRNSHSQESTRSDRFRATDSELYMLTAVFTRNPFPSTLLREKLAEKLGLTSRQIQFWFQNRRATLKSKGVHVIKPKKGCVGSPSAAGDGPLDLGPTFDVGKKRPSLSPLSEG